MLQVTELEGVAETEMEEATTMASVLCNLFTLESPAAVAFWFANGF